MKRLVLCLLLASACARRVELPVMDNAPDFALIERSSKEVHARDLAGKVWIADFVYTSCGGFCPAMTEKMRKLQDKLPAEIHLVSFSVDPVNDTPAVLAEYA